jgi:hypothetical protein
MKRLVMVLALVMAPAAAIAQPAARPMAAEGKITVIRGPNGKKTYFLSDGIVILGTRHRPNAVYVMERSRIRYDWANLRTRLVDRIGATVEKHPF